MATRFYFPSGADGDLPGGFTPTAPDAGWEDTNDSFAKLMKTVKFAGNAVNPGNLTSWTAGQDALTAQWFSEPIQAQTISGTVKCQLACREHAGTDNSTSRMGLRVVSNDGSVVRGTLLAVGQYGPATELVNNATFRNKTFADGDSVSSVVAEAGDRILVEQGFSDAAGTTPQATGRWGATEGTADLGENETESSNTLVPWLEFSMDIAFETAAFTPEDPVGTRGFFGI